MKTSISNSGLTAEFNWKGAELTSMRNNSGKEFIWDGNELFWGKHSPILFPIVGSLKNNSYTLNGNTYSLPRHGFARDLVFKVVANTSHSVTFSLESNAETKLIYPFDFELQIKYTLDDNVLTISYAVFNKTSEEMPFSIGAHPAFALPNTFEKYALEFENDDLLWSYQLENELLSEKAIPIRLDHNKLHLNYNLFENDALIFKQMQSKTITLFESDEPLLKFHFSDFANFGIWTKINAPFICLEPWLGYSDLVTASGNLTEKEGIQTLNPNAAFQCQFSIEVINQEI